MTKKAKLVLAGIFLLVLATAGVAYAASVYRYTCSKCGLVVDASSSPSFIGCRSGGHHYWNKGRKIQD
jgi:hypothetical protein